MFTATGSNCVKHFFMKENSIMVAALAQVTDNCFSLAGATHQIFTLYFRILNMTHDEFTDNYCDIPLAIRVCKIGIFCSKHGYFNPNETFDI